MPPTLPPELIRRIFAFISLYSHEPMFRDEAEEKQIKANQKFLNSLSTTGKLVGDIISASLYRDCIVENVPLFFSLLKPGQPYDQIERLQLYMTIPERFHIDSATTQEARVRARDQRLRACRLFGAHNGPRLRDAFEALRNRLQRLDDTEAIMPRLRRLTLGAPDYTCEDGVEAGIYLDMPRTRRGLPDPYRHPPALLIAELPSLRHICQKHMQGPLTLPSQLVELAPAVETFTIHIRPGASLDLCWSVPTVLGAINRLYSHRSSVLQRNEQPSTVTVDELQSIAIRVNDYSERPDRQMDGMSGESRYQDTRIELYAYDTRLTRNESPLSTQTGFSNLHGDSTSAFDHSSTADIEALSVIERDQQNLDNLLLPEWRGKILLKSYFDAPPCEACGLDVRSEWKILESREEKDLA